jgi:hypothetical protein
MREQLDQQLRFVHQVLKSSFGSPFRELKNV